MKVFRGKAFSSLNNACHSAVIASATIRDEVFDRTWRKVSTTEWSSSKAAVASPSVKGPETGSGNGIRTKADA
eukprot:6569307-Alexandrium_andersonii.AAC.1